MLRGFLLGILTTLLVAVAGAYVFVVTGQMPANADSPPSGLETWAARHSLQASIEREAPAGANPLALTDENLTSGVKLYEKNCMVCHGAALGTASTIAVGLYQEAPQLAKDGVEDDPDGKIFWKIKHGIRLTGMPGFSKTLKEPEIWQLSLFLKHMDALPPKVKKIWDAENSGH